MTEWLGLRGLRVLDLTRLLPGYATLLLADLGADVIKIESPQGGDHGRLTDQATFAALNRNKRSVTLDLRAPEGRDTLLRLVERADVVVESFRPGVMAAMGLGYEDLRAVNPRVVLCSITGFGQDGPYASRPGHDLNFLALSGFFAVPHRVEEPVDRVGVRVADLAGAMYAAFAITVATTAAAADGVGQHLDVSMHEAVASWAGPLLPAGDPAESPLLTGDNDVFRTADGRRIALSTFEDKFWRTFRESFAGEFPVLDDSRYDRRRDRTKAKTEVHALLVEVLAAKDFPWWCARLSDVDVPWAPVYESAAEVFADEHAVARELTEPVPGGRQVRFPVRFSAGLRTFRTAAPELGEHTDEVLAELSTKDLPGQ